MTFALALPLAAAFPRRTARRALPAEQARAAVHACQGQMRLKTSTEDGREVWACWCRSGEAQVCADGPRGQRISREQLGGFKRVRIRPPQAVLSRHLVTSGQV